MSRIPLSAIVLTYNSARTLDAVLSALNWCDEVLVVDSGSTDQTLTIAKSHHAKIIERKFTGFGDQKSSGVLAARNDWVFVVDSDEVVSAQLRAEIENEFSSGHGNVKGYLVPIQLVFLGAPLRFSGSAKKFGLRLFNRQNGNFNQALVHETVILKGAQKKLQNVLWHHSYLTLEDYFNKFNRYTTFGAQELVRVGRTPSFLKVWVSLPVTFIRMYILKGGLLDGYPGFIWCLFSSFSPVVKYAKHQEMIRNNKDLPVGDLQCSKY